MWQIGPLKHARSRTSPITTNVSKAHVQAPKIGEQIIH
jgi:hypothetical protein